MWEKLCISTLASAVSFGLAGLMPQDGTTDPAAARSQPSGSTVNSMTLDVTATPADELGDLYRRLRKIRAERLADKPKVLSDQAANLYKQAVEAVEAGETEKARALTNAARELTRALELSIKPRRELPADPDLPPPPRGTAQQKVFYYQYGSDLGGKMPPPLNEVSGTLSKAVSKSSEFQAPPKIETDSKRALSQGNIQIRLRTPGGPDAKRDLIIEKHAVEEDVARHDRKAIESAHATLDASRAEARDQAQEARFKMTEADVNRAAVPFPDTISLPSARAQAQPARAAANQAHAKVAEALNLQLREAIQAKIQTKKADGKVVVQLSENVLEDEKQLEAFARFHESLAGQKQKVSDYHNLVLSLPETKGGPVDAEAAIAELKKAYELILQARKDYKGDKVAYLETARDLYHSARKEAGSKHFERAIELARAAEALTKATHALATIHVEGRASDDIKQVQVYATRKEPSDEQRIVRIEIVPPQEILPLHEMKVEIRKEIKDHSEGVHTSTTNPNKTKIEVRKEIKEGEAEVHHVVTNPHELRVEAKKAIQLDKKSDAKPEPTTEKDEAGELVGLGVMISFEDGKALVNDLIVTGPAAKEGKIRKGDAIVGVATEKGATIGFADKELVEVTKILRGPVGSKVKVIVLHHGNSDLKIYEIERKKLEMPKEDPPKPEGGLPPLLD